MTRGMRSILIKSLLLILLTLILLLVFALLAKAEFRTDPQKNRIYQSDYFLNNQIENQFTEM